MTVEITFQESKTIEHELRCFGYLCQKSLEKKAETSFTNPKKESKRIMYKTVNQSFQGTRKTRENT